MLEKDCFCLILAGGQGTRLWPLSRKSLPKQFVDVYDDGEPLIKRVYRKMRKIFRKENIYVSTNISYAETVQEQLPDLDPRQIIREPVMKGRALSMTMGAFFIQELNPDAKVLTVPSDLRIKDEGLYLETITRGMQFVASHDVLLTIGVTPDRPDTRYGYIQVEDENTDGMFKVRSFTEKPEEQFAKVFFESGEFYWNSGILIWNLPTFMKTVSQLLPVPAEQIRHIFEQHKDRDERRAILYSCYAALPHISANQALLERSDNVYMAKGDFRWSDIESWDLLYDECRKDKSANVVRAKVNQIYNSNCNIFIENQPDKLVVIDGLNDFLVIDTDETLLICPRNRENEIKQYINDIKLKTGDKYI